MLLARWCPVGAGEARAGGGEVGRGKRPMTVLRMALSNSAPSPYISATRPHETLAPNAHAVQFCCNIYRILQMLGMVSSCASVIRNQTVSYEEHVCQAVGRQSVQTGANQPSVCTWDTVHKERSETTATTAQKSCVPYDLQHTGSGCWSPSARWLHAQSLLSAICRFTLILIDIY